MLKKSLFFILAVIILCLILFSCKGDPGAAGDKGPAGSAGSSLIVMQFQNGVYPSDAYTGTEDTFIINNATSFNNGNCSSFIAANTDCSAINSARGLIKFDVSSIVPSNVTVKKAYLELCMIDGGFPIGFVTHELTKSFEEGNSCNASGSASWISATATDAWTTPGGDYNPEPMSNIFNVPASPTTYKVTLELNPSVVQKWISNPAQNYGMIIKSYPEQGEGVCLGARFVSSEDSYLPYRPKLVIYYSLP